MAVGRGACSLVERARVTCGSCCGCGPSRGCVSSALILAAFVIFASGGVYDWIERPRAIGVQLVKTGSDEAGDVRRAVRPLFAVLRNINSQYVIEGIIGGVLSCAGGVGILMLLSAAGGGSDEGTAAKTGRSSATAEPPEEKEARDNSVGRETAAGSPLASALAGLVILCLSAALSAGFYGGKMKR